MAKDELFEKSGKPVGEPDLYACGVKFSNITTGEYWKLWRFEWWDWFLPHENYDPANNGRVHLFWKLYFRTGK